MLQLTPLALAPLGVGALGVYPLGVAGEVVKRWVPSFDGVDDRGQLQTVINLEGRSFVLAFTCTNNATVGTFNRIIGNTLNDDFRLYMGTGHNAFTLKTTRRDGTDSFRSLMVTPPQVGETVRYTAVFTLIAPDTYNVTTTKVNLATKEEIVQVATGINTRAILINLVGQALSGASWNGRIYDVVIDGTLWPMSEKDYDIQLPVPSGLGEELITPAVLENPATKNNQWTYLGDGRWEYVGDGSFNELRFIAGASHPVSGLLDFEIESITGTLSCVSGSTAIPRASFTTTGRKRFFYTDINEGSALGAAITFKRPSNGVVTSCIIKNISFRPLVGRGPNLATSGDFSNPDAWISSAPSVVVAAGALSFNNAAISDRVEQYAEIKDGKTYEITYTIGSLSSGSLRCSLIGTSNIYTGATRTAPGTYTEIITVPAAYASTPTKRIVFGARTVGTTASLVDNLVVQEVTTCNPLTLINMTNANWQEIEV